MKAGTLNKWVGLQSPTVDRNPAGEETVTTWTTYASVWAGIDPIGAIEQLRQGGQVLGQTASHIVTMRYQTAFNPSCRIVWQGRIFDVVGVINVDEANVEHRITCREST